MMSVEPDLVFWWLKRSVHIMIIHVSHVLSIPLFYIVRVSVDKRANCCSIYFDNEKRNY